MYCSSIPGTLLPTFPDFFSRVSRGWKRKRKDSVPYSVHCPIPYSAPGIFFGVPISVHFSVHDLVYAVVQYLVHSFRPFPDFFFSLVFCGWKPKKKVPPGTTEDFVRGGYPQEHHSRDRLRHFSSGAQAQR